MTFNQITLVGNLGRDPQIKYTQSGSQVCDFSLAVTTRRSGGEDETEWFTVVCWNRLAETVSQYLTKGKRALVVGRFRSRTWTGDDGREHFVNEVVASTVRFMDRVGEAGGSPSSEGASGPPSKPDDKRPPSTEEEVEDLPW